MPPKQQRADHSPPSPPPELTRQQIESLEATYGNRYLLEPPPDHKLPKSGMTAEEAMGLIEQEMVLDGLPARNLATFVTTWMEPEAEQSDPEKPARELHRSRRVSALRRDRAALHPDARRPLQRAGRDDRRAHAGIVRGDHARRAVAEVEVARAPRGGREVGRPSQPRVRRRRARRVGEVLPLLRRRAADRPAAAGQVHDRSRGRRAAHRREHDRRRRRARHDLHRARRRHLRDQRLPGLAQGRPGSRRAAARRRGQRRLRVAVPLPPLRVGLPARAGPLDQRLGPQVRPRLPGHRVARVQGDRTISPRTSCSTRTISASATPRSR